MADVKTQYITKVVNQMKRIYRDMWEEYQATGRLDNSSSSASKQNSKYF